MKKETTTVKRIIPIWNMAYKAKNIKDKLEIFVQLTTMGFDVDSSDLFDTRYNIIGNSGEDTLEDVGIYREYEGSDIFVSKTEFLNAYKSYKKPIIIDLNDEYEARVTKESVIVGCQVFSHQVIKDLYKAVININK